MKLARISIIALMLLLHFQLFGDTKIVDGEMSYEFTLKSNNQELLDTFYEYENNSNSQKIVERGDNFIVVRTVSKLGPLKTDISFPVGDRYKDTGFEEQLDYSTSRKGIEITRGGGRTTKREFVEKTPMAEVEIDVLKRTARSITDGASTQHEAVEMVMRYIRENVSYTLRSSSNPVDVLKTGTAYCEGYANVAALLLRVLGVPTKVVDSYIPPGHMWGYGQEGAGGYHAHVEVYYGDAGWVSYDPQATVHFVDPFHIVNYPRERTALRQGKTYDGRNIVDILPGPSGTNNFFQRDTTDSRASAVFVGKIYRSDGSVVQDSFRNDEWIYMRRDDGSATGIRILSNGQFAFPADTSKTVFYRDGMGGWYEQQVELENKKREYREVRLDREQDLIHIDLAGAQQMFAWYKSPGKRWMLEKITADGQGTVSILSDSLNAVVSVRNTPIAPKYVLNAAELRKGVTYRIDNLPRYLDADTPYISLIPPSSDAEYSLKFIELSSGRTYQGPRVTAENMLVPVPDNDFSTIVLQQKGSIAVASLPSLTGGKVSTMEIEGPATVFTIQAERANHPIHIALKRGRRYASLVSSVTNGAGELKLYFQKDLLNNGSFDFVLLHGNPIRRQRISLQEVEGNEIRLE